MKRLAIVALVALVAACTGEAEDTTTTTTGSTTTSEATTTSTEPTTTTAPYADHVVVYVLDTTGSNGSRQPPFLYPISVAPLGGSTELEAAVETLVAITGFDSAIPSGTTVDSVSQTGAIVEVDLSDEFEDDAVGSASVFARLAQLTFTLTRLDGVDGVLLVADGEPLEVFSSEGVVLNGPMVRDDFEDLVPGILVDYPAAGDTVPSTFEISGVAAAFEGVFQLEVLEGNSILFSPDFVSTGSGTGFGSFSVVAETGAAPGANLTIRVWENSAQDGSVISERFIPVTVEG